MYLFPSVPATLVNQVIKQRNLTIVDSANIWHSPIL